MELHSFLTGVKFFAREKKKDYCHYTLISHFILPYDNAVIWETFEWLIFLTLRRWSCGITSLGWTILNQTTQYTNMYCFSSHWRTKHYCSIDNNVVDTPITDKINQLFKQTHVQPEPADLLILLSLFCFISSHLLITHIWEFIAVPWDFISEQLCVQICTHTNIHTIKSDGHQGGTALCAWHQHKSKL